MDRSTHWLNHKRLYVYPRMVFVLLVLASIGWAAMSKNMVDPQGKPVGYDFITFWSASHLALSGHAQDAYSLPHIFKVENSVVPASHFLFAWYYPPPFYLLILPAALLPYLASYFVFILSTLGCYVLVFRRVVHSSIGMWCLAGFSGIWLTFFHGQNAFLTAALAAAGLLCLKRRPTLAGVFIGLLVIKPHLALLFPVGLIAIRAWRTFFTAAVTALAFTALSTAILGFATIRACLNSLHYAQTFLETGALPWAKMPTTFALLRILGMPVAGAYAVHAVVAAGAVFIVWRVWRRSADWQVRGASLMTATFFVSPYVFDYDLAWLAFPIAWLALVGLRDGWLRGEREILVAAWILPLMMAPISSAVNLQIGPVILGALLWMTMRRANSASLSSSTANFSMDQIAGSGQASIA